MTHELLNLLEDKLTDEFEEIKECRYYKGEFEENGEWNPIFPAVLYTVLSINPNKEATYKSISADIKVVLYTAFKLDNASHVEFFESLIKYLNELNLTLEDTMPYYKFDLSEIVLHGYYNGVEVYKINLDVTCRL